jgi:hypothetical protein
VQIWVIIEFRSSQLRPSQMLETNKPCVLFDVFLFYYWEWCKKLVTCVIWVEVSPSDFLPVHFLQVSFSTAGPLRSRKWVVGKTWKYSTNLYNPRSQTCLFFDVRVSLTSPKTCSFVELIKPRHLLTSLFWEAVSGFAGLFDGFYYIFTGESTSKADKFDNFRSMKILNTPVTQKSPGIRT